MRHGALCLAFSLLACQPRGPQGNVGGLDSADADTDVDADTDTDTDADADVVGCAAIDQEGPWKGHPIQVAGATLTHDPYTHDAGLGAVIAAAQKATSNTTVDLPVTGAVVLARGFVPAGGTSADFWIADSNGPMYAYGLELGFDATTLMPGDVVDMQVTSVNNYFGTLEITGATGVTVVDNANPVWVVDGNTGAEVTFDNLGGHVVELWGELIAGPDANNNFELEYAGGVITFRTFSAYDQVGDCVHWIGPVTEYFDVTQLNADLYDWYRSY